MLVPLKTILDGNHSMDNCLVLPLQIILIKYLMHLKKRPSRFKYVLDIEGIQCEKRNC
jgi:chromatin remodeling complex protein RSC6